MINHKDQVGSPVRNLRYKTGMKRVGAAIVDWVVFLPLLLFEQQFLSHVQNRSILIGWVILIAFLPILYSIALHHKYGQTIGKWVANVRVVDIGETRLLTLWQSILRDSFDLLAQVILLVYYSVLVSKTDDDKYILNDFRFGADSPFLWWTVLELITMLSNAKRRAIHDFIARSVVVRTSD